MLRTQARSATGQYLSEFIHIAFEFVRLLVREHEIVLTELALIPALHPTPRCFFPCCSCSIHSSLEWDFFLSFFWWNLFDFWLWGGLAAVQELDGAGYDFGDLAPLTFFCLIGVDAQAPFDCYSASLA